MDVSITLLFLHWKILYQHSWKSLPKGVSRVNESFIDHPADHIIDMFGSDSVTNVEMVKLLSSIACVNSLNVSHVNGPQIIKYTI